MIFSGKFRLPEGSPLTEIEDLADVIMANLDLSRVMHRTLGAVGQKGLSDLQKKRASIGIELMARPRILFVHKLASGLDTTSALLIIRSLKKLADFQGITICASLDRPRRDVFELFDSLLLLGATGKLVYHGPVTKVGKYFNGLNYYLHSGESITDWLLDISSGRLSPPVKRKKSGKRKNDSPQGDDTGSRATKTTAESSETPKPRVKRVTFDLVERSPSGSDEKENLAGSNTKPFDRASEQAKATCELLFENWNVHLKELSKKKRARYDPPLPFALPRKKEMPPFLDQLGWQLQRLLIVLERTWFARFIDTTLIVVAVILITLMDGVAQPTQDISMRDLKYDVVAEPWSIEALIREFPKLFSYSIEGIRDIES